MTESATPLNAGATKPEGSPEVGAQHSLSLSSSSLVLSSSSLRTLVEQWRTLGKFFEGHSDPHQRNGAKLLMQCADELAALLSPVAVEETHEDIDTRTGDDGLSTSSRTASTDTKG